MLAGQHLSRSNNTNIARDVEIGLRLQASYRSFVLIEGSAGSDLLIGSMVVGVICTEIASSVTSGVTTAWRGWKNAKGRWGPTGDHSVGA